MAGSHTMLQPWRLYKKIFWENGTHTKLFLYPDKLVIFCDPVASGEGACLDLTCIDSNCKISNKGIRCLP